MNKAYNQIDFENDSSPYLSAENLNAMSNAINEIDNRVVELAGNAQVAAAYVDQMQKDVASTSQNAATAKTASDAAKQSELLAEQYKNEAFSGTPQGYAKLVSDVSDVKDSIGNENSGLIKEVSDVKASLSDIDEAMIPIICGKNLMGMDANVYYPVSLKNGDTITISTYDGSLAPANAIDYHIQLWDKDKSTNKPYSVMIGGNVSRTITIGTDASYLKWNKLPWTTLQVEIGDKTSYEAYNPHGNLQGLGDIKSDLDNKTTPSFTNLSSSVTVVSGLTVEQFQAVKCGNVCQLYFRATANTNIASWTELFTLPNEFKPYLNTNEAFTFIKSKAVNMLNITSNGSVNTSVPINSGETVRINVAYVTQ